MNRALHWFMVIYRVAKQLWYMTVLTLRAMKKLQYCVYILQSLKDGDFYIGYTTNLNQRLTSHIKGNSFATSFRRPFELIFCEFYKNKQDATNREKYIKTTKGKRALRLMLKETLISQNLTKLS